MHEIMVKEGGGGDRPGRRDGGGGDGGERSPPQSSSESPPSGSDPKTPPSSSSEMTDLASWRKLQRLREPYARPAEDVEQRACFLCGESEKEEGKELEKCTACGLVWACCADHLEVHRPADRCFPFVIKRAPDKGRYMVAVRDIAPLELILTEKPAVVGPYSKAAVGCLQCFRRLRRGRGRGAAGTDSNNEAASSSCSKCGFPVCDEECAKGDLHQQECSFLASRKRQRTKRDGGGGENGSSSVVHPVARPDSSYVCITPLRMLLKKQSDPKAFARINLLMDHVKEGSPSKSQINLQLLKLILLLRDPDGGVTHGFPQSEIRRMIGILKTNGMSLEPKRGGTGATGTPASASASAEQKQQQQEPGCSGVALYPIYCLINHACLNNTNYVKFPDYHLELRSQLAIRKGEEITTRYISSTIGNLRRRDDILRYWYFHCTCVRCQDPTELGTYMSAVRCTQCQQGFLLPDTPLSYSPDWKCNSCDSVLPYNVVDEVISTIEKQIGEADASKIDELEEMLFHYQKILHPNHYILIDIMHNLVHLYAGKTDRPLTRPEKERKVQLCLIVLDTLGQVDPGYTKWRGTLLQELIHPLMMISKEDHRAGHISDREFQRRLSFCSRKLNEARLCLWGAFTAVEDYVKNKREEEGDDDDKQPR